MSRDLDKWAGDFLRAEDLLYEGKFHTVQVTIEEVIPAGTIETAEKKKIPHPTLRFVGKRKMLVLCAKTNQRMVRHWSGQDLEDSAGTTIILQPRVVPFGNGKNPEMVLALRVMPPKGAILPKNLKKMLGEEAVWTPPTETIAATKKPAKQEAEPKKSIYEQFVERIASKPMEELREQSAAMIAFITKENAAGTVSDDEFADLGKRINDRLVPSAETTEEPAGPETAE